MRRLPAVLVLVLAVAAPLSAKEGAPPAVVDVPSAAPLVAPPRVAAEGERLLVALPVAGGIDVVATLAGGTGFGDVVHAVRRDGLMAGGRRGARIAVSGRTVVLAAITRRDKTTGGDLLAWRSADGGATWGDAVRIGDVPGCAAEGLFDLAALGDGRFAAVWLDVREKGTRLRADFSADGAAWGDDVLAYESPGGSICECCAPAIAAADGGGIVAFRNSLEGDRDVWTARVAAGATKFGAATKSGRGAWKLAACPMAGPSVAVSGGETVCAWRREKDVFLVVGAGEERDLGDGTEPQVLAGRDGVRVLWIAGDLLFHLAPGAGSPREIARAASFPCAAADGSAVAWLDTATQRARLAVLR